MKETWKEKLQRKVREIFGNEQGVTLIELLAVVVILAIIAAVAVPAVMGNFSSAKTNTDKQNEQIIVDAINRLSLDEVSNGATVNGLYKTDVTLDKISFGNGTLSTGFYGTEVTTLGVGTTYDIKDLLTSGATGTIKTQPYLNQWPTPQGPSAAADWKIYAGTTGSTNGVNTTFTVGGQQYTISNQ